MSNKVNTPIIVFYQATNIGTGKTIQMNVYDEGQALDAGKSGTMTEIGSTGRYYKSFTPDVVGFWLIMAYDSVSGKGQVIETYTIVVSDISTVGTDVSAVKAKTENLPVDPASQSGIETAIDGAENNIRGADNDDLKVLSEQIDALESPAMVG